MGCFEYGSRGSNELFGVDYMNYNLVNGYIE